MYRVSGVSKGQQGDWGAVGCRGVRVHWGADRECRYSGQQGYRSIRV